MAQPQSKYLAQLDKIKGTLKRAKEETRAITHRGVQTALTAGTAYAAGAARHSWGEGPDKAIKIPGTDIEADLAGGVLLSLLGVSGFADDYSDQLVAIGSGMLAANLAIKAFVGGFDLDPSKEKFFWEGDDTTKA